MKNDQWLQPSSLTKLHQSPDRTSGKVFLIGAGPGDPGLMTVKGTRLLKEADVVVFDRLVDPDILSLIPPTAEPMDVGKLAGHHPVPQEGINQILVDQAMAGKKVVRLKGGDNFLFGRGGEELEALIAHKIPFEVVPGITSALAAPAYAGIPVTHRDYCSSVHVITGHKRQDQPLDIDFGALVRLRGTLVFLMSLATIGDIMLGLMQAGLPPETPAAVIERGTRPDQRKVLAAVGELEQRVKEEAIGSPALIVVGQVCRLSTSMDWFSQLPLKGVRILVTRPKSQAAVFINRLRDLGAAVTALPSIVTQKLDFDLPDFMDFGSILFTSASGVHFFMEQLFAREQDSRALCGLLIVAIGPATAQALHEYGLRANFVPTQYTGGMLASQLLSDPTRNLGRVLITRAKVSDPMLTDVLREASVEYLDLPVYETVRASQASVDPLAFDYVTFTSASCVTHFTESVSDLDALKQVKAVCIGQQTARQAQAFGMQVLVSEASTIDSMVDCLCAQVRLNPNSSESQEDSPC